MIKWNGKQLKAKYQEAQRKGINRTMEDGVVDAKNSHEWINRTGVLEGSIAIDTPATRVASGFAGQWGSRDVLYAIVHELGSLKNNIPARPYLRPAAAKNYPALPDNIKLFL